MTKDEREFAKSRIKFLLTIGGSNGFDRHDKEALNLAITSLEQEPCEKNTLDGLFKNIKKWEKEAEQEPCEDAISREDVIALVQCSEYELQDRVDNDAMCDDVRKLPLVTPSRRKGHWIEHKGYGSADYGIEYSCSNCNEWVKEKSKFCPNCGSYNGGDESVNE